MFLTGIEALSSAVGDTAAERLVETVQSAVGLSDVLMGDTTDCSIVHVSFFRGVVVSRALSKGGWSAGTGVVSGASLVGVMSLQTGESVDREVLAPEVGLNGQEPDALLGLTEEEVEGLSPSPNGLGEPLAGLLLSLG